MWDRGARCFLAPLVTILWVALPGQEALEAATPKPASVEISGVYTASVTCRHGRPVQLVATVRAGLEGLVDGELVQTGDYTPLKSPLAGRLGPDGGLTIASARGGLLEMEKGHLAGPGRLVVQIRACGTFELTLDPEASKKVRREVERTLAKGGGAPRRVADARGEAQICAVFLRWASRLTEEFPDLGPHVRGDTASLRFLIVNLFADEHFAATFGAPYDALSEKDLGRRGEELRSCFQEGLLGPSAAWIDYNLAPYFRGTANRELIERLATLREYRAGLEEATRELERLEPGLQAVDRTLTLARLNRRAFPFLWPSEVAPFRKAYDASLARSAGPALAELVDAYAREGTLDAIAALRKIGSGQALRESTVRALPEPRSWRTSGSRLRSPAEAPDLGDWVDLVTLAPEDSAGRDRARARELVPILLDARIEAELAELDALSARGLDGLVETHRWLVERFEPRFQRAAEPKDFERVWQAVRAKREPLFREAFDELHHRLATARERAAIDALMHQYVGLQEDREIPTGALLVQLGAYYRTRRMTAPCLSLVPPGGSDGAGEPTAEEMCEAVWAKLAARNEREQATAARCRRLQLEDTAFKALCLTDLFYGLASDRSAELIGFDKQLCRGGPEVYRCSFGAQLTSQNELLQLGLGLVGGFGTHMTGDFRRTATGWRYERIGD